MLKFRLPDIKLVEHGAKLVNLFHAAKLFMFFIKIFSIAALFIMDLCQLSIKYKAM